MLTKAVDRLLDQFFKKEPNYHQLDSLEDDVWTRINHHKTTSSTLTMIPVWSNTQLRYASLTLALLSGLVMSQISFQSPARSDTLGLEIFSPSAPFLMTSTFKDSEAS